MKAIRRYILLVMLLPLSLGLQAQVTQAYQQYINQYRIWL